jgi:outer membrane protein assembly factor BamD (BamD/ComL family)
MKAGLLALCVTLWAPYQCGTEPNERPQEDTAPKALWVLSEKFESEGNSGARETTLHQLVEQYPSSRYAEQARLALGLPSGKGGRASGSEKSESASAPDPESGDK